MNEEQIKHRIIELLQKNARMSETELSERLGVPVESIRVLMHELEAEHVIVGYTAIVRDGTSSDEVRAIIEVEVQPERDTGYDTLAERIGKFPEVVSLYLVSGRYDLRLEVVGKSLQEVASFVSGKLACQPGVKSTATYFMLKKYKEAGIQLTRGEKHERLKIVP